MKLSQLFLLISSMAIQLNATQPLVIGLQTPPRQIRSSLLINTPDTPEKLYLLFKRDCTRYGFFTLFEPTFDGPYYNRAGILNLSLNHHQTDMALNIFNLQSDWETYDLLDFLKNALYAKDTTFLKFLEIRYRSAASPGTPNQNKPLSYYLKHYVHYCLSAQEKDEESVIKLLVLVKDDLTPKELAKMVEISADYNALHVLSYLGKTYGKNFEVCRANGNCIYLWTKYSEKNKTQQREFLEHFEKIILLNNQQYEAFSQFCSPLKPFTIEQNS